MNETTVTVIPFFCNKNAEPLGQTSAVLKLSEEGVSTVFA